MQSRFFWAVVRSGAETEGLGRLEGGYVDNAPVQPASVSSDDAGSPTQILMSVPSQCCLVPSSGSRWQAQNPVRTSLGWEKLPFWPGTEHPFLSRTR